jgi:predicted RNase H-like HicB family nuclease
MKYAIVIEKGENSFGAYVPDLPGCVAVSDSREKVLEMIKDAIVFHLEGLVEAGESIPVAVSEADYIAVPQLA